MEKYGYEKQDEDPTTKIATKKGVCPKCGSPTDGQPPVCPKCGSEPFEKKEQDAS
jgi:ribosomal protein S27AE